MTDGDLDNIVPLPRPTRAQINKAYSLYTSAIGRVAHLWNLFHEELARLFARIVGGYPHDAEHRVALAVWHSSFNDRAQRLMLDAALRAANNDPAWARLPSHARDDLLWLIERTNRLGDKRDEAIHAPCTLLVSHEGYEIVANPLSGHRRAKALTGKQALIEFDWLKRSLSDLEHFAHQARRALSAPDTWPKKPSQPDRKPRKALLNQLRQLPREPRPRPPPTSQA